jgi:outer membrane protein assembly factor BamB
MSPLSTVILLVMAILWTPLCAHAQQSTVGSNGSRNAVTQGPVPDLSTGPTWVFPASDQAVVGSYRWLPQSTVVIDATHVYGVSAQLGAEPARLWAVRRIDGISAWSVPLPQLMLDSWSSPTLDKVNNTVLMGAGRAGTQGGLLIAIDSASGTVAWETPLQKDVVNASVLVTSDLGPADRAFVTDYEGFYQGASGASVYCINIDSFDAALNPYQPGELVWQYQLNDGASGATPAYHYGRIFVGTTGDFFGGSGGRVVCLNATALTAHTAVVWDTQLSGDDGFFGGMCVVNGAVYGATYDFFGDARSSRLIKLAADNGQLIWYIPSDRSSTIPVVLSDGRVLLSSGLNGFGSVPRLTLYEDRGDHALELWDTALSTWTDNGNGVFESGEYLSIGGWALQPTVRTERSDTLAVVGSHEGTGPMYHIYLDRTPSEEGFVVNQVNGGGGSPAIGYAAAYAIRPDGIVSFGQPIWPDVDGNHMIDIDDLHAWYSDQGHRDVDLSGHISPEDAIQLQSYIRRNERWEMESGRR